MLVVRGAVDAEDGFRAQERAGERRAVFCRLEHVVPWVISGAHWERARAEPAALEAAVERARCAARRSRTPTCCSSATAASTGSPTGSARPST